MSKSLVIDRVIKYLIEDLYVPADVIETNVPVSEFGEDSDEVIDIVVNVIDSYEYFVPVMIIRCVDEDIALEGDALMKQLEILEELDNATLSGRMVLTNGNEMVYGDWSGGELQTDAELPTYEVMVEEFKKSEKLADDAHSCGCDHKN